MTLKQQIQENLKQALKSKQRAELSVLRLLISAIRNEEIAQIKKAEGLSDDEIMQVISRQVKQRRDSIEQFKKGGRLDLAKKEEFELQILEKYLPAQLSQNEIRKVVRQAIAGGAQDIGQVMAKVMIELKGRAFGNVVRQIAQEELKS